MNDVVPECLRSMKQDYPCTYFILDDSTESAKRTLVDSISHTEGFKVIRRNNRKGFKAGAINNWLKIYGKQYDYFVLLDADSLLPKNWVEEILMFAEHPGNSNIAIFQGLINIWNTDNLFCKTLAPMHGLSQDEWEKKTANYLNAVVCYGHNALFRTSSIIKVNGFVEKYVSEDFATAVCLVEQGYETVFVPLHSYEALPENIRGFIKRQNKWTRGAMEFLHFVPHSKVTNSQKLLLLMIPLSHFAYVAVMTAMFLAIYGRISSMRAFTAFSQNLLAAPLEYLWSIPLFRFLIMLTILSFSITTIKLCQIRLGYPTFWKANTLSKTIGSIMLPYEVWSMGVYLVDKKRRFGVTPKDETPLTFQEVIRVCIGTIAITVLLALGIIIANPVAIYYNIFWFSSFAISPPILYYFSGCRSRKKTKENPGDSTFRQILGSCVDKHSNRFN